MIKFAEIHITELTDYQKLLDIVSHSHIDNHVIEKLKKYVGNKCDTVLVEYPYYDNEYLSNYYGHYSQKFAKYDKACYRIHFEKGKEYYGYMVLRPTPPETKFGKTYLVPQFLINKKAFLMLAPFLSHIYGQRQIIKCFPWKRQEGDISCCAHTATWAVLKYFGNKYTNYCDTTIGDVVDKVVTDKGRKTPTIGLTPFQVSEIFKSYNFSPLIIEQAYDYSFFDEVLTYVESGIPMVGFFNLSMGRHAVALIGHGDVDYNLAIQEYANSSGIILSTRLIKSVFVMDDRYFPYREVPKALPTSHDDVDYGMNQMEYAVIPLYKRMLLTYKDVYIRMLAWVKSGDLNFGELPVCRIYLTSSNSLKRKTIENTSMVKIMRDIIVSLSMPKFVWCIDFASIELYKGKKTEGRIIVDATASTNDKEPWILMHDSSILFYKDYDDDSDKVIKVSGLFKPYDMYINNLEEV